MDTSMINKIQKAKEYATQPDRITFNSLTIDFEGDNSNYQMTLGPDGWTCSCPGYSKYHICPHIMTIEKLFKPMLKRDPMPYANGQNIVSDVKKAKRYSEEPHRITIRAFDVSFQGNSKEHQVTYDNGEWWSTSSFFAARGVCANSMAIERVLKPYVQPIRVNEEVRAE